IALFATVTIYVTQGLTTVWGVSVAVAAGEDKSEVLNWKAVGALTTLIVTFVVARLSVRIGRKGSLVGAHIVAAVLALPVVLLLFSGLVHQYRLQMTLGDGIVRRLCFGPIAVYVSELLPPVVRYTGASVGYQLAAALGAGLSPMIASALILLPGSGPYLIGAGWALVALAGAIAVAFGRPYPDEDSDLDPKDVSRPA